MRLGHRKQICVVRMWVKSGRTSLRVPKKITKLLLADTFTEFKMYQKCVTRYSGAQLGTNLPHVLPSPFHAFSLSLPFPFSLFFLSAANVSQIQLDGLGANINSPAFWPYNVVKRGLCRADTRDQLCRVTFEPGYATDAMHRLVTL